MNVLALEWSAAIGSVALWADNEVVAQESVSYVNGAGATELVQATERARTVAGWSWDSVQCYAVGRGPGRYSGMRIALTVAQHLALPGATPVRAVSSGDALAAEVAAAQPAVAHVAVVGDARRDYLWQRLFTVQNGLVRAEQDWALATWTDWEQALPAETLVVSPDWERLKSRVGDPPAGNWITSSKSPSAEWVARLAVAQLQADTPPEPCHPIYLHPAVAARPA